MFDRTAAEQVAGGSPTPTSSSPTRRRCGARPSRAREALRLIAVAATGTDIVDSRPARARGVTVSNIRNYAVNTVPEHTFALILALRRSIVRLPRVGRPRPMAGGGAVLLLRLSDPRPRRLDARASSATACSARRSPSSARAFGMQVLFSDLQGHHRHGAALHAVRGRLRTSDVITLHIAADALDPQHDRRAPSSPRWSAGRC